MTDEPDDQRLRAREPSLLDSRRLSRRWHSFVFKKRRGPLDWLRRTTWFARTSVRYRAILILTILSLLTATASALVSSDVWLVIGLVSLITTLLAFALDWCLKARAAAALYSTRRPPTPYAYATPYAEWPEIGLPDDSPGIRYHPRLDEQLRSEDTPIALHCEGKWLPTGHALEAWRRWGGKRAQFNEPKIRLATDLLPGVARVKVEKTDYVAYVVTNSLADRVIRDKSKTFAELTFDEVGLRLGVIPELTRSRCSNHIGGDVLLVGDGVLWLQLQNHRNLVQPGALMLSASGSFDWDLDLAGADDLVTVVKNGLLRELEEELGLPIASVSHDDVRIVRYGRATYTGGKPQFFGLARLPSTELPRRDGAGDPYVEDVHAVDFDPADGVGGIVAALRAEAGRHADVSRPYLILVETLQQMHAAGDPVCDWILGQPTRLRD